MNFIKLSDCIIDIDEIVMIKIRSYEIYVMFKGSTEMITFTHKEDIEILKKVFRELLE